MTTIAGDNIGASSRLAAYREAVAFTESLIGPLTPLTVARTRAEQITMGKQRLRRTRRLLGLLGNPQRAYQVLHVAGTSGKGSTATLLGAMLRAGGFSTGIHTSPYLQAPVEKIEVDGSFIGADDFVALVDACRPAVSRMEQEPWGAPTYTELWAALPLLHFGREGVRYGVVEVSAGGRFDATNVVAPIVSAVTTVGYDHMLSLGSHLAEIAWHKAGIIKPRTPVVTGVQQPEALAVIQDEAREQDAPLRVLREGEDYRILDVSLAGTAFQYVPSPVDTDALTIPPGRQGDGATPENTDDESGTRRASFGGPTSDRSAARRVATYRVGLLGRHQASNAALALAALDAAGIALPPAVLRRGLLSAQIAGRFEIIQEAGPTQPRVALDGAHNGEKATVLATALRDLFPESRVILLLGVLQGKALHHVLEPLVPLASYVVATECGLPGKPATPTDVLAAAVAAFGVHAVAEPDPDRALDRALSLASPRDLVCVTGSLYLVGRVRERWAPMTLTDRS